MSKVYSQNELNSYLWDSAVLLRTHIDAGSYNSTFFPYYFSKGLVMFMMRNARE